MGCRLQSSNICKDLKMHFIREERSRVPEWPALVWRIALPACLSLSTGGPAGVQTLQKVEACSLDNQHFSFPSLNHCLCGNIILSTAQRSMAWACILGPDGARVLL